MYSYNTDSALVVCVQGKIALRTNDVSSLSHSLRSPEFCLFFSFFLCLTKQHRMHSQYWTGCFRLWIVLFLHEHSRERRAYGWIIKNRKYNVLCVARNEQTNKTKAALNWALVFLRKWNEHNFYACAKSWNYARIRKDKARKGLKRSSKIKFPIGLDSRHHWQLSSSERAQWKTNLIKSDKIETFPSINWSFRRTKKKQKLKLEISRPHQS